MTSLRLLSEPDEARMWLLCLAPGGGGAHLFRGWAARLPAALGVAALELPGHGSRQSEPLASEVTALVDALARDVAPLLVRPVVLFGHSMGAILAFDLVRRLRSTRGWQPVALIPAASEPPDLPPSPEFDANVSDGLLAAHLAAWGGTADELLSDTEYLAEVLPVLRGDLALMAGREHWAEPPLDCTVHIYLGTGDRAVETEPAVTGWARQSTVGSTVRVFPGGHFFVQESEDLVLAALLDDADAGVGGQLPRAARPPAAGNSTGAAAMPADRGTIHG